MFLCYNKSVNNTSVTTYQTKRKRRTWGPRHGEGCSLVAHPWAAEAAVVYVKEGGRTAQGTAQRNHAKRQQRHMMPSCVMHVAALRSPNQWTRPTSLAFSRADGSFSALLFLLLAPSGHSCTNPVLRLGSVRPPRRPYTRLPLISKIEHCCCFFFPRTR